MRRFSVLPAFLAAFLLTAVAIAASDKVVASFVAQSTSGISGEATLNTMPKGGTMIHGKLAGLQPDVEYVSQYFTDGACSATPATELARFKANPRGTAVFHAKTDKNIVDIKSISVQLTSDLSVQACASVNP